MTINGTSGLVFNDASTQNTAATGFGFKNRIINGAMMIDQRNAGASTTPTNTSSQVYCLDRWATYGSVASKFSVQQNAGSVTPPVGFTNYLGITSLSAYTPSSGDQIFLQQYIEGNNVADLAWGTANAQAVTLSFWVRSSLTGTFGGALVNSNGSRSYAFTYTISVANTWEQKSITITGDTTGTWLTNNSTGIQCYWNLGCGSTYSKTAGSWGTGNIQNATGSVSVVGTNGATFYITGVQLEKGSTATSFDYRPYGTELALCQRYYWIIRGWSPDGYVGVGSGNVNGTTEARTYIKYPMAMRTNASIGYGGNIRINSGTNTQAPSSIASSWAGSESAMMGWAVTGLTSGNACIVHVQNSTSDFIFGSAEL
jgi:hypothetical protein